MTTIAEQLSPLRSRADNAILSFRCAALGISPASLSPEQRDDLLSSIAAERASIAAKDEERHKAYLSLLADQDIDLARRVSLLRSRVLSEVPPAFQSVSYDSLLPQQKRAAVAVLSGKSGYIRGLPGTGKSTVAWASCRRRWEANPSDASTVIQLPSLLSSVKATPDWTGAAIAATSSQPLLFLDEVARSPLSDRDAEILFSVIDYRAQYCLQTVLLSNAPSKRGLAAAIGEAAFSRIASGFSGILDGSDLRMSPKSPPDA